MTRRLPRGHDRSAVADFNPLKRTGLCMRERAGAAAYRPF